MNIMTTKEGWTKLVMGQVMRQKCLDAGWPEDQIVLNVELPILLPPEIEEAVPRNRHERRAHERRKPR